jgi:hypothetical protein
MTGLEKDFWLPGLKNFMRTCRDLTGPEGNYYSSKKDKCCKDCDNMVRDLVATDLCIGPEVRTIPGED